MSMTDEQVKALLAKLPSRPWAWQQDTFHGGYSGLFGADGEPVLQPDCCNEGDDGAAWFDEYLSPEAEAFLLEAPELVHTFLGRAQRAESELRDYIASIGLLGRQVLSLEMERDDLATQVADARLRNQALCSELDQLREQMRRVG